MEKKTLTQSKRAGLSIISIATIVGVNVAGHLLKLPAEITERITNAIVQLSLGYIAAQSATDLTQILKNKNVDNNEKS